MSTTPLILYYSGNAPEKVLPLKLWLPTEVTSDNYWYYLCFLGVHTFYSAIYAVVHDTLFLSLNLHAALQFEILFHRLRNFIKNKKMIKNANKKFSDFDIERKLLSAINNHHQRIVL